MFDPELVVYNAGTDILDGDPLGRIKVKFGSWIHYTLLWSKFIELKVWAQDEIQRFIIWRFITEWCWKNLYNENIFPI